MLKDKEKEDVQKRLKKISGQIIGIDKMIDDERYCIDVLQQIMAARAALTKVALIILENHAKSCMVQAVQENRAEQSIEELMEILKQFNK